MKAFRVSGKFRMGRSWNTFTIETIGADEDAARDRVYSTMGSKHRIDRHAISISEITEVAPDQIQDPVVEKKFAMVK